MLRLNHLPSQVLSTRLTLGGVSTRTTFNAMARLVGPLFSPPAVSKQSLLNFGGTLSWRLRRAYLQVTFVWVSGLGSATTADLTNAIRAATSAGPALLGEGGTNRRGMKVAAAAAGKGLGESRLR